VLDIEEKLKRIEEISKNYYDEATILIFVFIDYLMGFIEIEGIKDKKNSNKASYRKFLVEYSGYKEDFTAIQVDKVYYDCQNCNEKREKYSAYLDTMSSSLEKSKHGDEIHLSEILKYDEILELDKKYFCDFTVANLFYEYRCDAVHSYKVHRFLGNEKLIKPYIAYTGQMNEKDDGYFSSRIPLCFMISVARNLYNYVNDEVKALLENPSIEEE